MLWAGPLLGGGVTKNLRKEENKRKQFAQRQIPSQFRKKIAQSAS
jgi:hypothetical protein